MSKRDVDFISTDEKLQKKISSDQELNALKRMRDLQENREDRQEIQEFIKKRIAELVDEYKDSEGV